jgi:hypothetical protein
MLFSSAFVKAGILFTLVNAAASQIVPDDMFEGRAGKKGMSVTTPPPPVVDTCSEDTCTSLQEQITLLMKRIEALESCVSFVSADGGATCNVGTTAAIVNVGSESDTDFVNVASGTIIADAKAGNLNLFARKPASGNGNINIQNLDGGNGAGDINIGKIGSGITNQVNIQAGTQALVQAQGGNLLLSAAAGNVNIANFNNGNGAGGINIGKTSASSMTTNIQIKAGTQGEFSALDGILLLTANDGPGTQPGNVILGHGANGGNLILGNDKTNFCNTASASASCA